MDRNQFCAWTSVHKYPVGHTAISPVAGFCVYHSTTSVYFTVDTHSVNKWQLQQHCTFLTLPILSPVCIYNPCQLLTFSVSQCHWCTCTFFSYLIIFYVLEYQNHKKALEGSQIWGTRWQLTSAKISPGGSWGLASRRHYNQLTSGMVCHLASRNLGPSSIPTFKTYSFWILYNVPSKNNLYHHCRPWDCLSYGCYARIE